MKNLKITVLLLLLIISGEACKKGEAGPQGQIGETGQTGTRGERGTDGKFILSGSTAPADKLGNEGDYYLDKSNYSMYGPKTATGWGNPVSLTGKDGSNGAKGDNGADGNNDPKGDKGDKGTDGSTGPKGDKGTTGANGGQGIAGSQILSGTINPLISQGVEGDYFFNKSSGQFFGPKTAAGWGTGVALRGVQGPKGDKGETGARGEQGERGAKGDKGDTGAEGNANVKFKTVRVSNSDWSRSFLSFITGQTLFSNGSITTTLAPKTTRAVVLTEPLITSNFLQNGMVLVYLSNNNGLNFGNPVSLPLSFLRNNTTYNNYDFRVSPGQITIHFYLTPNGTDGTATETTLDNTGLDHSFRYYLVTGTQIATMTARKMDLHDHQAVAAFLGGK